MRLLACVPFLFAIGCASTPREEEARCQADPKCKEASDQARAEAVAKQIKAEEEARARENERQRVKRSGTSLAEFEKAWGEPNTVEIVDGKTVYWYDGTEPSFAIFNKDKLVSWIIDRNKIAERRAERIATKARQEAAEQQQDAEKSARRARILESIRNSHKRTTCSSHRGFGGNVVTDCQQDD